MSTSTLFNILWTAWHVSPAEKVAALLAATAHLLTLPSHDAASQLVFQGGRVLHLLAVRFWMFKQAAAFLSLVLERGRESCGATVLLSLAYNGMTPLHTFAIRCSDLSLTKMVLREHPPSLTALDNYGMTPCDKIFHGSTSERSVFFRAASAAFNASDFVALVALCGGSSPFLARELRKQAIALRAAVAICLNRQEAAPSDLSSDKADVALSLLERVRDFGRVGNSSDLLRRVLEYVGPYSE